jgi:hypothetical protein
LEKSNRVGAVGAKIAIRARHATCQRIFYLLVFVRAAPANLEMTVASFPNFFIISSPNSSLVHNSVVYMIESQIRSIMACLAWLGRGEVRALGVKKEIEERFKARNHTRLQDSIWTKGSTRYCTADGRTTANWPGYSFVYRLRTRVPKWRHYAAH